MINLKRDSNPLSVKFNMENNELSKYFNGETNISSFSLKEKLFNFEKKDRKCENCEITEWQGNKAPLELHHINGNNKDNSLENLQILCPNCHAQTKNYRALNKKKKVIKKSIEEIKDAISTSKNSRQALIKLGYDPRGGNYATINDIQIKYNIDFKPEIKKEKKLSVRTIADSHFDLRRVEWPTRVELLKMMWKEPLTKIGKKYGVSDNAIRKWAKHYGIPFPPRGYWAKLQHGHDKECLDIKKTLFKEYNIEW